MEINRNWISDLQVSFKNGAGKKAFHILQVACLLMYRGRINHTTTSHTGLKQERASPVLFWDCVLLGLRKKNLIPDGCVHCRSDFMFPLWKTNTGVKLSL